MHLPTLPVEGLPSAQALGDGGRAAAVLRVSSTPQGHMKKLWYPLVAMLAIVGCEGAAAVEPDATTASGTWVALDQVPGSHERWTLTISGAAVQGTGDWSREACCGGVVTITGTAGSDSLHLNVAYHRTLPTEIAGADPVQYSTPFWTLQQISSSLCAASPAAARRISGRRRSPDEPATSEPPRLVTIP